MSEDNAERLVRTLSRMRGAALKLGQMISIQGSLLFPAEILHSFSTRHNDPLSLKIGGENRQQVHFSPDQRDSRAGEAERRLYAPEATRGKTPFLISQNPPSDLVHVRLWLLGCE